MRTRYFSDEELEKYHKEGRIHDDKVEYTDVHEIYYTAILTTLDGRHYRVRYYQYKNYPDDRYFYDEYEELFLVPKLTLEMGYSSTPEPETRISDDIMKTYREELVEMLETVIEGLLERDWGN
jgi:hypothetical protein